MPTYDVQGVARAAEAEQPTPPSAPPPRAAFEPFGVSDQALVAFVRAFATCLGAGLPLLRSLTTLRRQSTSPGLSRALGDVANRIQQGDSIANALAHHRALFSDLFVSMVRLGEASGSLDTAMGRLADMMEREHDLRRKVRTAMAYPLFVLFFSLVLVYAMMVFLLPGFMPFFRASGINLARDYPLTWLAMRLSNLARDPAVIFGGLLLVAATVVAWRLAVRTPRGRLLIDTLKLRVPCFSALSRAAILVRFCRTFATLSATGVPLLECLKLVGSSSGNVVVARSMSVMARSLQEGQRLSRALAASSLFPPLLVQMVAVGEETATLSQLFNRLADYYERDLEHAIATLTSLIEPLMMLFVGGIVCAFVLAVLLPILGMSSLVGGRP